MSIDSQSQFDAEDLRQQFESMANDPTYKFRRSRRGMYVNPAVSRDWKWFQIGAAQKVLALTQPAVPSEHYDEVRATLIGLHALCVNISNIERRVGPLGSHARGYTHKITAALRHLDRLAAAPQPEVDQPPSPSAEEWLRTKYGAYRGHPEWRTLEVAFNAGMAAQKGAA